MAGRIFIVVVVPVICKYIFAKLAIQNLRGVLKAIGGDRKNGDDVTLLSGVNFVHGDIFDVITTVKCTFTCYFHLLMLDLGPFYPHLHV